MKQIIISLTFAFLLAISFSVSAFDNYTILEDNLLKIPLVKVIFPDNQKAYYQTIVKLDFEKRTFEVIQIDNLYCNFSPERENCFILDKK